jgi:hypothetical protein
VGPRADLDARVRRKIPSSYPDSNPPINQTEAQRYNTELSQAPYKSNKQVFSDITERSHSEYVVYSSIKLYFTHQYSVKFELQLT